MRPPAADGDRSRVDDILQQGTALSLKARETASLSLKRIFEQHVQSNSAARSSSAPHHLHHYKECLDHHAMDLELRLATPSHITSFNYQSGNAEATPDEPCSSSKVAQLTVFYGGTVSVFEDVPADKAKAIMLLASGSAGDQWTAKPVNGSCSVNAACKSRSTTPDVMLSRPGKPRARSQAELPFARKASLARFLEKRKDRVQAEMSSPLDEEISTQPPQKRLCTQPSLPSTNDL